MKELGPHFGASRAAMSVQEMLDNYARNLSARGVKTVTLSALQFDRVCRVAKFTDTQFRYRGVIFHRGA